MRARYLDRLDDLGTLGLEPLQFLLEHAVALRQHRHLFGTRHVKTLFQ